MNLKSHFKYTLYLLTHKFFVFQECLKLGVPLWAAIIHDWQKFTSIEWGPQVYCFTNGQHVWHENNAAFDRAWLHHIHYGPHHPEYWILPLDNGQAKILDMLTRYRREMLADWHGAGRVIAGENNTVEWYLNNRNRLVLHADTRYWVEEKLGVKAT